ncbi:hypothetical protein FHS62_001026 [Amphiplicatus metriothermophilus]|nr:hypothetical protein [Amphiplicatus metriothermophilus]
MRHTPLDGVQYESLFIEIQGGAESAAHRILLQPAAALSTGPPSPRARHTA